MKMYNLKTAFMLGATIFILLGSETVSFAQEDTYVVARKRVISLTPVYQRWTNPDKSDISQISTLAYAYLPFGRSLGFTLRGNQASTDGDNINRLNSFTDLQLGLSYRLPSSNFVLTLGLNFPTGLTGLTREEFATSALVSINQFNFRTTNFGQGLNVTPGISWATPLSDRVVLGLGASYLFKGDYKPLESMTDNYGPGDEVAFTAGLDFLLDRTTNLTADIIVNVYGRDLLAGEEVFESGAKIVANIQFRKLFGFNELWFMAMYRNKAKNNLAVGGEFVPEALKVTPNQLALFGRYRLRLAQAFGLGFLGEIRAYEESSVFSQINLVGVGIAPEIIFSNSFRIPFEFKYYTGSVENDNAMTGVETRMGLSFGF